jgi:hypothetical protein
MNDIVYATDLSSLPYKYIHLITEEKMDAVT